MLVLAGAQQVIQERMEAVAAAVSARQGLRAEPVVPVLIWLVVLPAAVVVAVVALLLVSDL
jgi:hypothetical protein